MKEIVFEKRLEPVIHEMDIWFKGEREFALSIQGPAGCGKTQFIEDYLESRGLDFIFCTVPDEGSYKKDVESKISAYDSSFDELIRFNELRIQDGKQSEEIPEHAAPYVVIDESQHFISELDHGIESFQHGKKSLKIGEVKIPYNRLILISHKGLGKNNSETTRFSKVVVPAPTRAEIIESLVSRLGFPRDKAKWSATHSKCNFRSAIDNSHAFGTPAQTGYNPRGLSSQDIEVLWFYFRSDPSVKSSFVPEDERLVKGTNQIGNCSAYLGLDPDAIKQAEGCLKEEGILSTGTQSKRVVVTRKDAFTLTLGILKLSGKFKLPEAKPEAKTPTSKPTSKPTAKTPTSKLDKVRPDKTPAQIQAEIRAELDSKKVPSYYDDMSTEDLTSAI